MTAKPSLKRSVTPNFVGGILPMFVALVTTPICLQHISVLRAMVCSPSSGWYKAIRLSPRRQLQIWIGRETPLDTGFCRDGAFLTEPPKRQRPRVNS